MSPSAYGKTVVLLAKRVPTGVIEWVRGLFFWGGGPWPLSRVADVQLTWLLFLRLAVLHIFLSNLKRGRNYHFYLQTVHPRGGSHLPLRCCFWVPARATAPWFRWIAWRPRDHSESQCQAWQNGRITLSTLITFQFSISSTNQKNRANKNRVFWPFRWRSRTSE
jgi:hypothetical protein